MRMFGLWTVFHVIVIGPTLKVNQNSFLSNSDVSWVLHRENQLCVGKMTTHLGYLAPSATVNSEKLLYSLGSHVWKCELSQMFLEQPASRRCGVPFRVRRRPDLKSLSHGMQKNPQGVEI